MKQELTDKARMIINQLARQAKENTAMMKTEPRPPANPPQTKPQN